MLGNSGGELKAGVVCVCVCFFFLRVLGFKV